MSTNKSDNSKSKRKTFEKPSVVTQQSAAIAEAAGYPLETIPDVGGVDIDGALEDMSQIEVDKVYMRYNKGISPQTQTSKHHHDDLEILEDQEPFNRRQSFLNDLNHEPYWQNEKGLHPFQTPKSQKSDSPFFNNKNIITTSQNQQHQQHQQHQQQHINNNHHNMKNNQIERNSDSYSRSAYSNSDEKQSNSNSDENKQHQTTSLGSNHSSLEMAIPEDNELMQMPGNERHERHERLQQADIYGNDDIPNHTGRNTEYIRNGQMRLISLYKIEGNIYTYLYII